MSIPNNSRQKNRPFNHKALTLDLKQRAGKLVGVSVLAHEHGPQVRDVGPHLCKFGFIAKKEKHHMANILETARADRAYNKYVKGLESMAGLVETLSGPGPFTLFIPTDAAFDRLSDDQQVNLFADPGKLARVLKYHIVPGYYTADDLLDRLFLKTLEGQRLRVWSSPYSLR
jgi:uncharacterized surface protein with fasciclin (FAS1) repeats